MDKKDKNTEMIDAFIDHLFNNYRQFWTQEETNAYDHFCNLEDMKHVSNDTNAEKVRNYIAKAWITMNADKATLNLLKDGFESFKLNLTNRIYEEHPNDIHLNLCPRCGEIARTPQAKQCRWCGHDWH